MHRPATRAPLGARPSARAAWPQKQAAVQASPATKPATKLADVEREEAAKLNEEHIRTELAHLATDLVVITDQMQHYDLVTLLLRARKRAQEWFKAVKIGDLVAMEPYMPELLAAREGGKPDGKTGLHHAAGRNDGAAAVAILDKIRLLRERVEGLEASEQMGDPATPPWLAALSLRTPPWLWSRHVSGQT